jgi:hypothetical protein
MPRLTNQKEHIIAYKDLNSDQLTGAGCHNRGTVHFIFSHWELYTKLTGEQCIER